MNASTNHSLGNGGSEPLNLFLQRILTPEGGDQHISILDQLFDEFICALQLDFVACDALSEIRTVQERVGELQRREPHGPGGFLSHFWLFWKSFGSNSHRCSGILSSDHLCKLLRLLHFLTSARVLGFGTMKAVVVWLLLVRLGHLLLLACCFK